MAEDDAWDVSTKVVDDDVVAVAKAAKFAGEDDDDDVEDDWDKESEDDVEAEAGEKEPVTKLIPKDSKRKMAKKQEAMLMAARKRALEMQNDPKAMRAEAERRRKLQEDADAENTRDLFGLDAEDSTNNANTNDVPAKKDGFRPDQIVEDNIDMMAGSDDEQQVDADQKVQQPQKTKGKGGKADSSSGGNTSCDPEEALQYALDQLDLSSTALFEKLADTVMERVGRGNNSGCLKAFAKRILSTSADKLKRLDDVNEISKHMNLVYNTKRAATVGKKKKGGKKKTLKMGGQDALAAHNARQSNKADDFDFIDGDFM